MAKKDTKGKNLGKRSKDGKIKKVRKSLRRINVINKHNNNAKKRKNESSVDPFKQNFLPKIENKLKVKKIRTGQKPSKKMQKVLKMIQHGQSGDSFPTNVFS